MPKPADDTSHATKEAPPAAPAPGGLQPWLPLLVSLVMMPALAYGLTTFVLIPKLKHELGGPKVQARETEAQTSSQTEDKSKEAGQPKTKVQLSKIVVNVSGSQGARLLLASFTLAGYGSDFKSKIEENSDQLRDLASSTLGSKTIGDLEKPEARNLIRSELLSQFNGALRGNLIKDLYITELAVQ